VFEETLMRTMTWLATALALALTMVGKTDASGACFASLTSGAGPAGFTVCLSNHGNIVQWTTPAGVEHSIRNDGYVLCSLPVGGIFPVVHGWDAGVSTEEGFGPPVINQPNGANTLPLTITRATDDGVFELEQRFARDGTEKDLTITMAVTNTSRTTRNRVQLGRYFGMSPNHQSNSPNNASTTSDSVFLWDDPDQSFVDSPVYGVMLTALSYATPHRPVVEDHDDWNPQDDGAQRAESCSPIAMEGPVIDLLDLRGRITYDLGTLRAGGGRRVQYLYRHL
jgi:hypothetical protein